MTDKNLEQELNDGEKWLVDGLKKLKEEERQKETDSQKQAYDNKNYFRRNLRRILIGTTLISIATLGYLSYIKYEKTSNINNNAQIEHIADTLRIPVGNPIKPAYDTSNSKPTKTKVIDQHYVDSVNSVHARELSKLTDSIDRLVATKNNHYVVPPQVDPITGQFVDSNSTSKKSIADVVNETSKSPKTLTELNIPGNITSNYTIEAGNYILRQYINVSENGKLTINEGAILHCGENFGIRVHGGQLQILGTKEKPVLIDAKVHSWLGIKILDSKKDNKVENTEIRDVKGYIQGAIEISNSYIDINSTLIELCETGVISRYSTVNIDNTNIKNNHNRGINGIGSKLNISNSNITDNYTAENGGGIYVSQTFLVLDNVNIQGNKARSGGGMYEDIKSDVQMYGNNVILDNTPDNVVKYQFNAGKNNMKYPRETDTRQREKNELRGANGTRQRELNELRGH